jgi:hypothetical protein
VGSSRVLNTVIVAGPTVIGGQSRPPIVVGAPVSGAPSVVGEDESGAPVDIGGGGGGTRPVWVGHGPPVLEDLPDAEIRDLYLNLDTFDLYQLGG